MSNRITQLKTLFPEVVSNEKIDFEKLKSVLREEITKTEERYELTWAGKKAAFRATQEQTTATLQPKFDQSINFETAQHIFIEGENLEVLRVLQKSYFEKIKMIYIDPPYNTGNDSFVYPDDYSEKKRAYEQRIGQKDAQGFVTKQELWRKHTKENGQFHSIWLSMMYPRLLLSRNLLREDGIIFVSIDENELANLRLLMDEVFGEENFIDIFCWTKSETPANLSKKSKKVVEYILCYQKYKDNQKFTGRKKQSKSTNGLLNQTNREGILAFPANVVQTKIKDGIIEKGIYGTNSYRIELLHDTEVQNRMFVKPILLKAKFKWTQNKLEQEIKKGTQIFIATNRLSPSYEKTAYDAEVPPNLINAKVGVATNEVAGAKLAKLMGAKLFDFPKPVSLLKYLMKFSNDPNGIFLDFFAGSGTLAAATIALNSEDRGNRKFICVQLPEKCTENSLAFKNGYSTIAEITRTRITKVIQANQQKNIGFKAFQLSNSHFKTWQKAIKEENEILKQLAAFQDPIYSTTTEKALIYELLLKNGLLLTAKIEEKNNGYFVNNNQLVLLLKPFDKKLTQLILESNPQKVICLDSAFKTDAIKTNFVANLKEQNIPISFA